MLTSQVAELEPIDRLCYWMQERHCIYLRRKLGWSKPWTDDEILQNYFFTNPYRENDKVTAWFRENVREPLADDDRVVFATICFRWFNYIPTGILLANYGIANQDNTLATYGLLEAWNTQCAVDLLESIKDKVFTGAFNISNSGSTKPKINRVCEDYIEPVWKARWDLLDTLHERDGTNNPYTMEEVHAILMELPAMGGSGFMAYEVTCDLRYTWVLRDTPDKCTWSNPGPGAKRGINRILERDIDAKISRDEWEYQSQRLLAQAQEALPYMPALEMREIEHSLCEFDKYERARLNEGHMKRRYPGGG